MIDHFLIALPSLLRSFVRSFIFPSLLPSLLHSLPPSYPPSLPHTLPPSLILFFHHSIVFFTIISGSSTSEAALKLSLIWNKICTTPENNYATMKAFEDDGKYYILYVGARGRTHYTSTSIAYKIFGFACFNIFI